jgi:hypothetical protein
MTFCCVFDMDFALFGVVDSSSSLSLSCVLFCFLLETPLLLLAILLVSFVFAGPVDDRRSMLVYGLRLAHASHLSFHQSGGRSRYSTLLIIDKAPRRGQRPLDSCAFRLYWSWLNGEVKTGLPLASTRYKIRANQLHTFFLSVHLTRCYLPLSPTLHMSKHLGPPAIACQDPGTAEEGTFKSSKDDLTLYLKRWFPTGVTTSSTPPRALVILIHGYLEHYGRYENIFPLYAQANIAVTAFDQRGHGKTWTMHPTPKKAKGNFTWPQQFQDVEDLIRLERKRLDEQFGKDKVPIYLLGHSMVSSCI